MTTTPPEQPGGPQPAGAPPPPHGQPTIGHLGYTGLGRTPGGAVLPIPGNAEFVLYLVAEIVLAIVAAASDGFDAHGWAVATTWITAAYLISRGIAKASRVLEQ